jgi:hypothetical protein
MTGSTDIRAGRHAANEAAYRRINERIRRYEEQDDHDDSDPMTFLCECAEGACMDHVQITLDDYRHVRENGRRFIIAPNHDAPEIEDVVERHADYWVVQKHAAPEA